MPSRAPRKAKPLRRRVATRAPRRTFLLICEGKRTEPEYLNALKRERVVREVAAVDLRVQAGRGRTEALQLVQLAVEAKQRNRDEEGEIDEVWCIFDVESPRQRPGLRQAAELARQHDVRVAISNPCFEQWLILHLRDQSRELTTAKACELRRKLDGSKDKGIDASAYMQRRGEAVDRAAKLDEMHRRNETAFPKDNPSSGMHFLLAAVEAPFGPPDG